MLIKKIEKIPDKIFNDLKLAIQDKSVKHNTHLAGNIEQEYRLDKHIPKLEKYLINNLCNIFIIIFPKGHQSMHTYFVFNLMINVWS